MLIRDYEQYVANELNSELLLSVFKSLVLYTVKFDIYVWPSGFRTILLPISIA